MHTFSVHCPIVCRLIDSVEHYQLKVMLMSPVSRNVPSVIICDRVTETWPVRKENEVALQRAETRMVRWMCLVKVKDRVPSKQLRERLGIDDIILILQQNRLQWYGHVLQKEDTDWVKKYMEYEVEGSRPRDRPNRTWKEVVQKDCQACNLNKEDAMDRVRWKKLIKIG